MTSPRRDHHRCPGCRTVSVPDDKFGCRKCWSLLPLWIQVEIYRTESMHLMNPDRRRVVDAALSHWTHLREKRSGQ